jgi:hypothetical protein
MKLEAPACRRANGIGKYLAQSRVRAVQTCHAPPLYTAADAELRATVKAHSAVLPAPPFGEAWTCYSENSFAHDRTASEGSHLASPEVYFPRSVSRAKARNCLTFPTLLS